MRHRILAVALVSVALASPALAQPGSAPEPSPQKGSGLSDADKLQKSAEHLARMKASLKAVLGRVEEARNEKDVVKLNCVNEKLTQIKGLLKVAEQSDIALHEGISGKDSAADSEFAKIGIARSKVDGLRNEAEQCIGQLAYIVDEKTTVEVQQPTNLPDRGSEKGTGAGYGTGIGSSYTRPPAPPVIKPRPLASPFQ